MHDNAWARALIAAGHEVSLVPTYTPIRLDEPSQAADRVFFGGINVYLDGRSRLWRRIPRRLKAWLDRPGILKLVSKMSLSTDASQLGDLTLAMLQGEQGPHRHAVEELVTFVVDDLKPDVVIFSNALLSGAATRLKERFRGPVCVVLQGDDVFLDGLPASVKQQAISAISERAIQFDRVFTHSRFYRDYMARYLSLNPSQFEVIPLSIDATPHTGQPNADAERPPTVGYFARIAPEKGLHRLVDAVEVLRRTLPNVRLRVGGSLSRQHEAYFRSLKAQTASWGPGFESIGSPETLEEKVRFFESCDVFSVPAEFLEPKGLYVLEAMANGIPVVQPATGAFPELIEGTGGGWLFDPEDPGALASTLMMALCDREQRRQTAARGHASVRERHSPAALAAATTKTLQWLTTAH
jgi:glycosyltransferase involved in cell wall biosynthesis